MNLFSKWKKDSFVIQRRRQAPQQEERLQRQIQKMKADMKKYEEDMKTMKQDLKICRDICFSDQKKFYCDHQKKSNDVTRSS